MIQIQKKLILFDHICIILRNIIYYNFIDFIFVFKIKKDEKFVFIILKIRQKSKL